MINFSAIFKGIATSPTKPVDAFTRVHGFPSNEEICDSMLEDATPSTKVVADLQSLAQELGFSKEESNIYW